MATSLKGCINLCFLWVIAIPKEYQYQKTGRHWAFLNQSPVLFVYYNHLRYRNEQAVVYI